MEYCGLSSPTILNNLENNNWSLGMFINLSKAYDWFNHEILLSKLLNCEIRGEAYDWIRSYLLKRRQQVFVNGDGNEAKSKVWSMDVDIAQGSIVGSIPFIMYINDILFH